VGYSGNGQSYAWSYFGATPWFQANTTINVNGRGVMLEPRLGFAWDLIGDANL
jgi:hypothetical protein